MNSIAFSMLFCSTVGMEKWAFEIKTTLPNGARGFFDFML